MVNFGSPIDASILSGAESFGQAVMKFNSELETQLKTLVVCGDDAAAHYGAGAAAAGRQPG